MTNYEVKTFINYDDFKTYIESLPTTTDVHWNFSEDCYIVIVG